MSESFTEERVRPGDSCLDEAKIARVNRGIAATFDFIQAMVDDPSLNERIPDGAQLIFEYDDDPTLSEANLRAGARIEREGGAVYVHRVRSFSTPPRSGP